MEKGKVLSNDFQVCVEIYDYSNVKKEKIWFSKLVKVMSGDLSSSTISKSIDRLFDLGMIDGDWEKVEGRWTRTFRISGEAEGFVKSLYDVTQSK
jgi:DNA-binding transcriptional ArsR family regulator